MRGKQWTKNEKFKAIQLQAMGYGNREIAEIMHRSYSAVNTAICRARGMFYASR